MVYCTLCSTNLQDQVGYKAAGLVLGHVVILVDEVVEHHIEVLEASQQNRRVGVEEAQGQPFEDQVQVGHQRRPVVCQVLDQGFY